LTSNVWIGFGLNTFENIIEKKEEGMQKKKRKKREPKGKEG
jgi:hypothetical protein